MSGFVRNRFVHEALMHHPSSTLAYQLTASQPKPDCFCLQGPLPVELDLWSLGAKIYLSYLDGRFGLIPANIDGPDVSVIEVFH